MQIRVSKNKTTQEKRTSNFDEPLFLDKLKQQDHGAVTEIVNCYSTQLLRASLGLGFDQASARDLVQNVWLTFFNVVKSFEGRSQIRTFVFGILYNKASEMRRDQNRLDVRDPIEEILDARFDKKGNWIKPPLGPEEFLSRVETMDIISRCLDALPMKQKMAFSLKDVQEEETTDICNILNLTPTNLGVLLFRARNRLRECIERKAAPEEA